MNILVVGNVLNDIYLNIDSRTENFETDKNHTKWLNLSFDASEHHFFSRESSLGGAAVTLEVLEKMGLKTVISGSSLTSTDDGLSNNQAIDTHRYILISDGQVSYLTPSEYKTTKFATPDNFYDYIYIDRSAELEADAVSRIKSYLSLSQNTKLVLYVCHTENPNLNQLIPDASLIFSEERTATQKNADATHTFDLDSIDPQKIIHITDNSFSYLDITESFSPKRADISTHLSIYSIASATILGSFILGKSVEDSFKMARINVEHSKLNASLTLEKLQQLAEDSTPSEDLELTAASLVLHPRGILAADESGGSIKKKFAQLNIDDTYENRRDYRNIFFSTPDLAKYVNGVILFDETARQLADDGQTFVDYLTSLRIIPGIKVDQGLAPLNELKPDLEDSEETYTKGLEGLPERLKEYYTLGLRFAKWRAAFKITLDDRGNLLTPTDYAISKNCQILAEYAADCQAAHIIPIVEPELVYDGNYDINTSAQVTGNILDTLFQELKEHQVNLKATILKVNMVLAGKQSEAQSTPAEVGQATADVLKAHVPADLAGVVFLSGGQTPEQATDNLAAIRQNGPFPWPVTFSFARALQDPALYAWAGDNNNSDAAKAAFKERLITNTNALNPASTPESP